MREQSMQQSIKQRRARSWFPRIFAAAALRETHSKDMKITRYTTDVQTRVKADSEGSQGYPNWRKN
jgi:hypothetical protein